MDPSDAKKYCRDCQIELTLSRSWSQAPEVCEACEQRVCPKCEIGKMKYKFQAWFCDSCENSDWNPNN